VRLKGPGELTHCSPHKTVVVIIEMMLHVKSKLQAATDAFLTALSKTKELKLPVSNQSHQGYNVKIHPYLFNLTTQNMTMA